MTAASLAVLLLAAPAPRAPAPRDIPAAVRSCSVTVTGEAGGGSGTLFRGRDGRVWCLTAAHVVAGAKVLRVARHRSDPDGRARGEWVEADVVAVDAARDLALLGLGRHAPAGSGFARLARGTAAVDSPVYACGSQGLYHHHALLRGHVTAVGRRFEAAVVDEDDIAGGPGTSGCGVFLRATGELAGVHIASNRLRAGLYVPARVVREWARVGGFLAALE